MWVIHRGHEPWLSFYWTMWVFSAQSRPKGTAPSKEPRCLFLASHGQFWGILSRWVHAVKKKYFSTSALQIYSDLWYVSDICDSLMIEKSAQLVVWHCETFSLSLKTDAAACNFVPKDLTCELLYHHRLRVSGTMKHADRRVWSEKGGRQLFSRPRPQVKSNKS